tara:strand:+ start:43532 stop:44800 length:1269 start_codon:yes stop_codon:yes gene_type:complete
MIDLSLLRMMKHRDSFYKIRNRVPTEVLNKQTSALLADYGKYFDKFPAHEQIDFDTFMPMFMAWHPKLGDEHKSAYQEILKQAKTDLDEDKQQGIMHSLMELRLGGDLAKLLTDFDEGDVENIHAEMESILTNFRRDAGIKSLDFLRDKIGDLLQDEIDDSGLRWRLDCLNQSMRGLRPGDFGIVAGRPDKGKTTLLASEMTHMASQLPGERTLIWLNNEGPGRKIITRQYQAALGIRMSEMILRHQQGRLETDYEAVMKMPWRVRVFDVHGMDTYAVERIIEQNNTGIVVYDMIDNIRGFGDAARTDLALEKMYQWGRELCVKYDCIGVATSQISNEGDGMQFPTLPMLKDSKTGKQGACDFQLMIGASNDPGLQRVRYIGLPKNKLRREGAAGDPRATVKYEPEIARYTDLPTTIEGEDA